MHSTDDIIEHLLPEERLLLGTVPPHAQPSDVPLDQIHWARLHLLAADERAGMAVWHYLERWRDMPDAPLAPFRQLAMVMEFKQQQLHGLMKQTLASLDRAGLKPLLLKGAAVSALGLADFLDRPMADLDILLPEQDARQAWNIAQRHGWFWDRNEFPLELYRHLHHLPPLIDRTGSGQRLEIHHDLFSGGHPFAFGAQSLWTRAATATLDDQSVYVPALEDVLLHVCLHFSWSHAMQSKAWRTFRDLYVISASGNVAWHEFVSQARTVRAASGAFWTLRLASQLAAAPIPDEVLDELRPNRPAWLLARLERHYAQNMFAATQRCLSLRIQQRCWELGMQPTRSGHGSARPWNVSITLPATAREHQDVAPTPSSAKVRRVWRTARYLVSLSLGNSMR